MPKNGDLRVWWVPQVPMESFYVKVNNLEEAKLLLDALADYDRFQYENNVKPDYSNAGGLEEWLDDLEPDENGEKWSEWYDEETGDNFDQYCEEHFPRKSED